MAHIKPRPVRSFENLRARICRLLKSPASSIKGKAQLSLEMIADQFIESGIDNPRENIKTFLDFFTNAVPTGDVYLFGGVLRDMALFGRRGFSSDIDLVVEGDWQNCVSYLEALGATRNKFGGYRYMIGQWPVDVWYAPRTWAIKNGYVKYNGIASLTNTTVLNWDAILMNWRTKQFISRKNYLEELNERILDVVLIENPDPLGMAVRVLRHFCTKDARKVSLRAVKYLSSITNKYSFENVKEREAKSYNEMEIDRRVYDFFRKVNLDSPEDIKDQYSSAIKAMSAELGLSVS